MLGKSITAGGPETGTVVSDKSRVLLVLSRDVLDRARVFAGKATATLKLPVSLQIVLRALIEEGLRRNHNPALLANVEGQVEAVRLTRSAARRGGAPRAEPRNRQPAGISRRPSGREPPRRRQ
jgi:hypothetical protein